jgi:shikimate kinase
VVTADSCTRPVAVLIGPPGSGKTTVGAVLADRLGCRLRDTDQQVEARAGRTIADIFVVDGEPAFRELERAEVLSALAEHDGVVALGGGAVMDEPVADALAGHTVVFLEVGIADAAARVGFNRSRPLMAINPRGQWVKLMDQRRATYERLATLSVDTAGRAPEDVVDEIVERLESSSE